MFASVQVSEWWKIKMVEIQGNRKCVRDSACLMKYVCLYIFASFCVCSETVHVCIGLCVC